MGLSPYRTQGWQKRFHYPKALPAYVSVFTACHIIDYSLRPNMNEQVQANKQGVWSLTHMLIHLHCLKKRKRKRVKVINFFEKEKPSGSHLNKTGGFCKCLWQTVLKASCVPPGNYLHFKKKKKFLDSAAWTDAFWVTWWSAACFCDHILEQKHDYMVWE